MIHWTLEDEVYELTLSRPPCNEIGLELLSGLERFLSQVDPLKGKAVVIHSTQEAGFCAGADLRALYTGLVDTPDDKARRTQLTSFINRIHAVMDKLDTLPLTTVGAIHGVCFGGGFELALTCDVLVADKTARFCFPELRLGIIPGFGGIPRLKRELGNGVVRDLLLTGRSINAKKAQEVGLVSQVVGVGKAHKVAKKVAKQATLFDGEALRTCKEFMKPIPHEELQREKQHFLRLVRRPVVEKALKTFVESDDIRPYLPG